MKKNNLAQGHARLTAFAAHRLNDASLAQRAWREFSGGDGGMVAAAGHLRHLTPPDVLAPIDEVAFDDGAPLSTNAVAQWGLAAIALLALLDEIPPSL